MSLFKKVVSFFVAFWNAVIRKKAVNGGRNKQKRTAKAEGKKETLVKTEQRYEKCFDCPADANPPNDDIPGTCLDDIETNPRRELATLNLSIPVQVDKSCNEDEEVGYKLNCLTDPQLGTEKDVATIRMIETNDDLLIERVQGGDLVNRSIVCLTVNDAPTTKIVDCQMALDSGEEGKDDFYKADPEEREPSVTTNNCDISLTPKFAGDEIIIDTKESIIESYDGFKVFGSTHQVDDSGLTATTSAWSSELERSVSRMQLFGTLPSDDSPLNELPRCPTNFSVSSDSLVNFLYCSDQSGQKDNYDPADGQSCLEEIMCTSKGILKLSDSGVNPDKYYPLDSLSDEILVSEPYGWYPEGRKLEHTNVSQTNNFCTAEHAPMNASQENPARPMSLPMLRDCNTEDLLMETAVVGNQRSPEPDNDTEAALFWPPAPQEPYGDVAVCEEHFSSHSYERCDDNELDRDSKTTDTLSSVHTKCQGNVNFPSSWKVFTPKSAEIVLVEAEAVLSDTLIEIPSEELAGTALRREMSYTQQSINFSTPDESSLGGESLIFTNGLAGANDARESTLGKTFKGMLDTYLAPNEFSDFYSTANGASLFPVEGAVSPREGGFNPCVGAPPTPRPCPRALSPANMGGELVPSHEAPVLIDISECSPTDKASTKSCFRGSVQDDAGCNSYNYGLGNLYGDMMFPTINVPACSPFLFSARPESVLTTEVDNSSLPSPPTWLGYQLSDSVDSDGQDDMQLNHSNLAGYQQLNYFDGDGDRSFYDNGSQMSDDLYFRVEANSNGSLPIGNMMGPHNLFSGSLGSASTSNEINESPSNCSMNFLNLPQILVNRNAPDSSTQRVTAEGNLTRPQDYSVTEKFMNDVNLALNASVLDQLKGQFRDRGDGEDGDVEPFDQESDIVTAMLTASGLACVSSQNNEDIDRSDSQSCSLIEEGQTVTGDISPNSLLEGYEAERVSTGSGYPETFLQQTYFCLNSQPLTDSREVGITHQHVDNCNTNKPQPGCSYESRALPDEGDRSEEDVATRNTSAVPLKPGTERTRKSKRNRRRKKKSSTALPLPDTAPDRSASSDKGTGDGTQILQFVYGNKEIASNELSSTVGVECSESTNDDNVGVVEDGPTGVVEDGCELRSSITSSNARRRRNRRRHRKN